MIPSKYSLAYAQVARDVCYHLVYATLHSGTLHLQSASSCSKDESGQNLPQFTYGESMEK